MSIFAAIVRTAINVVTLPVTLPLAVVQDLVIEPATTGHAGENTKQLIEKIKDEAESE